MSDKSTVKFNPPYIGAAYYPEVWPIEEIDKDISMMKEIGLNCARIGEFAWGSMEPREGEFDFSWLKSVIGKLADAGIATVVCTPTNTPPKWLTDKYPETLLTFSTGVKAWFGARNHVCKTSPIMREKNRIIVEKMCEALKGVEGIIGWQIDNEVSYIDEGLYGGADGCYCELCAEKFQKYLKEKYKTIENLNSLWVTARWSQQYSSFEDILPPKRGLWRHPSLYTEWLRFSSGNLASYVAEQSGIIKKYFDVPVGTDMRPTMDVDYYKMHRSLDIVQYNHYDLPQDIWRPSLWFDFCRPIIDKPFWNTETLVSWNGSHYAEWVYRPENNCYINAWLPVAKGGEMNLYWLWRAHAAGHELMHGAVLSSSGRFDHAAGEIKRASEEFGKCADFLNNTKIKSEIALHFSATACANFKSVPWVKGNAYDDDGVPSRFHRALLHYNVDLIDTEHSLEGYKVIISPLLTTVDENGLKQRITEWVKDGGVWIVGPLSDIMTDYAAKYTNAPYSFLEEFAGIYVKYSLAMQSDKFKAVWHDNRELPVDFCYDGFELKGAESLAKYTAECLKGLSAVAQKRIGKGKVIVLGTEIPAWALLELVGLPPVAEASENVELVERQGGGMRGIICMELYNREGWVKLDGEYVDLIGGKMLTGKITLRPYQVLALKKV